MIDNYIICINQDEHENLWIGTNNGICRYNYTTRNFEDYSLKINLPDNVINGIVPDLRNNLWISTNKGLSKYSVETSDLRNYDLRDGLQSNEFNRGAFFRSDKGEIFFGGINGYSAFYPDKVVENKIEPEIIFTDFKLFNNSVKPGDKNSPLTKHISETSHIKLNYTQSFFTLDFVALNFLMPEKNLYKYKLEGYNNDWVELVHERKVSFMNLPDGDYNLKIIASNNDEVWNMEGISVKISILPPPWKTGWAYIIYIGIIGLLIWFWQQLISSRLRQKNEILNERREKERNEELNQLKLYFFTNITHEFRTPLTLISAPLDNLISDDVPKDKKEFYYRLIKENIRRLKRLVDQLMDFRKAEHERLMLKVRSLDLDDFIHRMADNFIELAKRKNIDFKINFQGQNTGSCWFDPEILDKIIYNLLSNAFKFTPDGGNITIQVNINGNAADVSVSDSGIGISPEDLPYVFERFYTSAKTVNKYYSGTGIGLSFSKRLAEIHHGTLNVESTPGKGSVFTLQIPVKKEEYSVNEIFEDEKSSEWNESQESVITDSEDLDFNLNEDEFDGKNILLIVEDNEDLSAYLKTQFSNAFKVYTAFNGKEGFNLAREKMPDIIISDVMMSEMDGFEFCKKIKNDLLTNHIPVVLLTALSSIENKMNGIDKGADAYIEKPFEIKYLDSVIHNLLKQRVLLREKYFIENRSLSKPGETGQEAKFLLKFEEVVLKHLSDPDFSVTILCSELNLSRSQLFRKFRSITGNNPSDFIRIMRLKKAAEIILKENIGVNEVAYEVGFTSPSHFISSFKKYYGKTPGEYSSQSH
jgi:signal transduction histidine kinase/DNA-binding response OmpR family regulator